jgi:hypothetical protein
MAASQKTTEFRSERTEIELESTLIRAWMGRFAAISLNGTVVRKQEVLFLDKHKLPSLYSLHYYYFTVSNVASGVIYA